GANAHIRQEPPGVRSFKGEDSVGQQQTGCCRNRDVLRTQSLWPDRHDACGRMLPDIYPFDLQRRANRPVACESLRIPFISQLQAAKSDARTAFRRAFRMDGEGDSVVNVDRSSLLQTCGDGCPRAAKGSDVETGGGCYVFSKAG